MCVCVCVVVQRADDAVSRRKKTDERTQDDKGGCCMLYMLGETLTHTTVTHYTCCPYTLTKMVWCVSNCLQGCICHQSSRYHMQVTGKHRIYMVCCFGVQNAQIVTEPTCVCIHVAPILAGPACRSIMDHNEESPWVHYAYKSVSSPVEPLQLGHQWGRRLY